MPEKLLDIRNLEVGFNVYGGKLNVLNGINFSMKEGEKVGLVGETGCGKTSTAKSILKILPAPPAFTKGGEILFKGKDILKMKDGELREIHAHEISMIFQDPTASLNPVFTIGDQLKAAIKYSNLHSGMTKQEIKNGRCRHSKRYGCPTPNGSSGTSRYS